MQQTEIYQLNKIDLDDTFSPDPINENTEKLEAALTDMEDRLDQRITTLEGRKMATGTYSGTYTGTTTNSSIDKTIHLGFTPAAVFVFNVRTAYSGLALPNYPMRNNFYDLVKIVSGGFYVSDECCKSGMTYNYLALL